MDKNKSPEGHEEKPDRFGHEEDINEMVVTLIENGQTVKTFDRFILIGHVVGEDDTYNTGASNFKSNPNYSIPLLVAVRLTYARVVKGISEQYDIPMSKIEQLVILATARGDTTILTDKVMRKEDNQDKPDKPKKD